MGLGLVPNSPFPPPVSALAFNNCHLYALWCLCRYRVPYLMSADLAEGPEEKAEEVTPDRLLPGEGGHMGNGTGFAATTSSSSGSSSDAVGGS